MAKLSIITFFATLITILECMTMPVHQGILLEAEYIEEYLCSQVLLENHLLTASQQIHKCLIWVFWPWKTFCAVYCYV